MNRSVLYIAATLPFSVVLACTKPVGAVEAPAASPNNSPVLSVHSKPVSTITFMQRESDSQTGKLTRSLLIAAPSTAASSTEKTTAATPVAVQAPLSVAVEKPVVLSVVAPKLTAEKPSALISVAPKIATAMRSKSPALTPQATLSVESTKAIGPVLAAPKPSVKSKQLVALNSSQPEPVRTVQTAQPTAEKSGTNVLAGIELYPKTNTRATAPASPTRLASREARAQQLLLARLDADLARAERSLQRSDTRLSEGQRQLGSINNILKSAMVGLGDEGKGLHPFVRVAQRYLGTPYVWGGESARGFDCSGFIMRVMRDLGYKALPHSAAEQFRYGTPVAKPLLKAGDVVFFANTYKPGVSHVGIYLGRGRFIHAANSQVGTIVSGLNEPKWVAHYAGARRLVSQ